MSENISTNENITNISKMKYTVYKYIKLTFFYIVSIALLLLFMELILFFWSIQCQKRMFSNWGIKKQFSKYYTKAPYEMSDFSPDRFRKDTGLQYKKKSILIFGCSHLYGAGLLNNEQTFSYKLSESTQRPVYNRAFWGWAPSHMLYILQNKKWIKDIKEPEYIFTLFMPDYEERFYFYQGWPYDSGKYLRYTLNKNDTLKLAPVDHYPWYWRLLIIKYVQYSLERFQKNKTYTNKLYLTIMQENMNIIKKDYPNAKVIILLYQGSIAIDNKPKEIKTTKEFFDSKPFDARTFEELNKMGYLIINMEELVGHTLEQEKYKIKGDPTHPNEKVWDEVIPLLKNELSL